VMTIIPRRCLALVAAVITVAGPRISERVRRCLAIKKPRCYIAFLAAVVTAIAVSVPASPASAAPAAQVSATTAVRASAVTMSNAPAALAAPAADTICLTNDDSYCLGISPEDALIIVAVIKAIVDIIRIYKGKDPDDGDNEYELEDSSNGLCLTDTGLSLYDQAWLGPCGADGTVWVWIPDSDGYRLFSRYSIDNGYPLCLTVDPLSNGAAVYLYVAEPPGGAFWQNFSYY
jgi:hypothetical protein